MTTRKDSLFGCLLGGALGDALGAPIEFMKLSSIREEYGSGGVVDLTEVLTERNGKRIALITDDTQMTLFTAEGFLRACNRFRDRGICDPLTVMRNAYIRWLRTQGLDIDYDDFWKDSIESGWLIEVKELHARRSPGSTCLNALITGKPVSNSKGCGGVMRVAPIGFLAADPFRFACDAARLTHGHPCGYLPAGFLANMIAHISCGKDLISSIYSSRGILQGFGKHKECLAAIDRALEMALDEGVAACPETVELLGGGWVGEEALSISVYCSIAAAGDFKKGLSLAVNHSGDSDSTGAITGNIMGAQLGMGALPKSWLEHLELREVIEEIASDMFNGVEDLPDSWSKYPPY